MGAPWPEEEAPSASPAQPEFDLQQRKSEHWVWQPIQSPPIPEVENKQWPRNDLDQYLIARLEEVGLQPSPDVDQSTLLRRLYFDLIGLPPTPEQAAEFLSDDSHRRLSDWSMRC